MSKTSLWRSWGQGWSGGLIYLFLEDWELARVALSCRLAFFLCQEMREASKL